VLTANNFVKLTWVSQSETEMLGYRVYRGESGDQASAIMITPTMIGATNTSTTQSYSITDNEVSIGSTYCTGWRALTMPAVTSMAQSASSLKAKFLPCFLKPPQ
jgi:hypothetical protein